MSRSPFKSHSTTLIIQPRLILERQTQRDKRKTSWTIGRYEDATPLVGVAARRTAATAAATARSAVVLMLLVATMMAACIKTSETSSRTGVTAAMAAAVMRAAVVRAAMVRAAMMLLMLLFLLFPIALVSECSPSSQCCRTHLSCLLSRTLAPIAPTTIPPKVPSGPPPSLWPRKAPPALPMSVEPSPRSPSAGPPGPPGCPCCAGSPYPC